MLCNNVHVKNNERVDPDGWIYDVNGNRKCKHFRTKYDIRFWHPKCENKELFKKLEQSRYRIVTGLRKRGQIIWNDLTKKIDSDIKTSDENGNKIVKGLKDNKPVIVFYGNSHNFYNFTSGKTTWYHWYDENCRLFKKQYDVAVKNQELIDEFFHVQKFNNIRGNLIFLVNELFLLAVRNHFKGYSKGKMYLKINGRDYWFIPNEEKYSDFKWEIIAYPEDIDYILMEV